MGLRLIFFEPWISLAGLTGARIRLTVGFPYAL
jgi:hypothetical protein